MNTDRRRLDELLMKLLDGHLSHGQRNELAAMLRDSPTAQREYLELLATHTALCQELGDGFSIGGEDELSLVGVAPPPSAAAQALARTLEFVRRPTPLSMSVAALVVGALLTALAIVAVPMVQRAQAPVATPVEFVATVSATHRPQWGPQQVGAQLGGRLRIGHRLALRSGLAEITYDSGTKLTLVAPAEIEIARNGCRMISGELSAAVPQPAIGFAVETPTAFVVDLGTQFVVRTEAGRRTEVRVVHGAVEMSPRSRAEKLVLRRDESAVANAKGALARVVPTLQFTHMPRWQLVRIDDASFEQSDALDVQVATTDAWTTTPPNFNAVFDPGELQFAGTWGDGANTQQVLPRGGQVGIVESTPAFPRTTLQQTLAADALPGRDYTLTFWVGRRDDRFEVDYRVELLAGEKILISAERPVSPKPGQFRLVKLTATAPADAQGKLKIRFLAQGIMTQTCLDEVRLHVLDTPPARPAETSHLRLD